MIPHVYARISPPNFTPTVWPSTHNIRLHTLHTIGQRCLGASLRSAVLAFALLSKVSKIPGDMGRKRRTAINSNGQMTGLQWHGKATLALRSVGAERAVAKREARRSVNFMIVLLRVYEMDL
jgi:hypothetical protein